MRTIFNALAIVALSGASAQATGITALIAIARGIGIDFSLFDYDRGILYIRPYVRFDSILIGACLAIGLATSARFLQWAIAFSKSVLAFVDLLQRRVKQINVFDHPDDWSWLSFAS